MAENSKFKSIIFAFIYNLEYSQPNSVLLSVIILLSELLSIHYSYLNPHYPWMQSSQFLKPYFETVFPNLFYIHQASQSTEITQLTITTAPVVLIFFAACLITLTIVSLCFKGGKASIVSNIICLILKLTSVLIFRIAAEISTLIILFMKEGNIFVLMILTILSLTGLVMVIIVLLNEERLLIKGFDFIAMILLSFGVLWQVILAFLGVKIVISFWLDCSLTKFVKFGFQFSLYCSIIFLMFVKHSILNFITIAVIVTLVTFCPLYDIYQQIKKKDISEVNNNQEQENLMLKKKFTLDDFNFIKKINRHCKKCQNLYCLCKQFYKEVETAVDIKQWAVKFKKAQYEEKTDFRSIVQFTQICVKQEQMNILTLTKAYKKDTESLKDEYQKYKILTIYRKYFEANQTKLLPHKLWENQFEPKQQIIEFQHKISEVIELIRIFWGRLLAKKNRTTYIDRIQQISVKILQIIQLYREFRDKFDQNNQIQILFKLFKLIVLHQSQSNDIQLEKKELLDLQRNYFMLSCESKIINISYNLANLLQKFRQKLLESSFDKFMLRQFATEHQQWIRNYLSDYKTQSQAQFLKFIILDNIKLKVITMQHVIIPQLDRGINIMTCMNNPNSNIKNNDEDQIKTEKKVFHLLITRVGLCIVAYQQAMLQYFNIAASIDIMLKIKRSTVSDIFPNINEECISKGKSRDQKTLARSNLDFFDLDKSQKGQSKTVTTFQNINKRPQNDALVFQFSQVPLHKTKQLGYVILKFENYTTNNLQTQQNSQKLLIHSQIQSKKNNSLKQIEQITQGNVQIQESEQKKTQRQLFWCKIVNFISLICFVFVISGLFALIEQFDKQEMIKFNEIQQSKKFLKQLLETSLYMFGVKVGTNRLSQMRQLWSQNTEYLPLMTSFQHLKNQDIVFNIQDTQIIAEQMNLQSDTNMLQGEYFGYFEDMFGGIYTIWGISLLLIFVNITSNCFILVKSQKQALIIMKSFMYFKKIDINQNILELMKFQKRLGLKNYNEGNDESSYIDRKRLVSISQPDYQQSAHSLIQKQGMVQMNDYLFSGADKMQRKVKFNVRQNSHNRNKEALIIEEVENQSQEINKADSEFNFSEQLSSIELKGIIQVIIAFCLLVGIGLFILLFNIEHFDDKKLFSSFSFRISNQSIILLQKIEELHLNIMFSGNKSFNELYYQDSLEISKLSTKFKQFIQFQQILYSANLCELELSKSVKESCQAYQYLFEAGQASTLEYVSEYLRKIKIGEISRSELLAINQFSVAVKVLQNISQLRSCKYLEVDQKITNTYKTYATIEKIVFCLGICLCIYLQYIIIKFSSGKAKKAQNLFKIVPKFMRITKKPKKTLIKPHKKKQHKKIELKCNGISNGDQITQSPLALLSKS